MLVFSKKICILIGCVWFVNESRSLAKCHLDHINEQILKTWIHFKFPLIFQKLRKCGNGYVLPPSTYLLSYHPHPQKFPITFYTKPPYVMSLCRWIHSIILATTNFTVTPPCKYCNVFSEHSFNRSILRVTLEKCAIPTDGSILQSS